MRRLPLLLLPLLAVPLAAQAPAATRGAASPIAPGQRYTAGTRVVSPAAGVSFVVPSGHAGAYDTEAQGFLLVETSDPAVLVAVLAYSEGAIEAVAEAVLEVLTANNITLYPRGEPQMDGSTMSAMYNAMTPRGQGVLYGTVRTGSPGNAIAVVAFGPPAEESRVREIAVTVLETARFAAPGARAWVAALGGNRLVQGGTNSAYSPGGAGNAGYASQSDNRYDFCSDGSYAHYSRSESYISVEGAGSAERVSHDEHQGRWRLVADIVGAATLVLQATDGRWFYLKAAETPNGVQLDGTAYGVQPSPLCR